MTEENPQVEKGKSSKRERKSSRVKKKSSTSVEKEKKAKKTEPKAEVEKSKEEVSATKAETSSAKKSKKRKKKVSKVVVARGKRKESVARATIRPGKGNIRINKTALDALNNRYVRYLIRQPLSFIGPEANNIDINVNVVGGGVMGQAQAARTAIANALVRYFEEMKLKEKFLEVDRSLLIEDVRRVEPKKYKGRKARARFQKSYR